MFGKTLLTLIAAFAAAAPAQAWGPIGHRVSADIAERNVSGKTRAHVARILGSQTMREASTVPDEQRNNPDPFWQAADPWHYITLPRGTPLERIAHPEEGDAWIALGRFTSVLRNPAASETDQRRALQFIIHLVSDLHQPLHVGDEVYRGGGMPVAWFGQTQTLHWVWDEGMINQLQLSSAEYADRLAARTTPEEVLQWWEPRPIIWLEESAQLRTQVFAEMDAVLPSADGEPLPLSWQYQYDWRPVMELRLRQSGYRLAAYLDWVFAEVE